MMNFREKKVLLKKHSVISQNKGHFQITPGVESSHKFLSRPNRNSRQNLVDEILLIIDVPEEYSYRNFKRM